MNKRKLIVISFVIIMMFLIACNSKESKQSDKEPYYHTDNNSASSTETNIPDITDGVEEVQPTDNADVAISEFTGIESSYETPESGNLSINLKVNSNLCLICPDSESDAIYYVNYGKDNYIYCLENGISTLIVEMKTTFLQYWNKELYFLSGNEEESSSDLHPKHNIYKYNFDTKEVSLILDANAFWLNVNSTGIYYTVFDTEINFYKGYKLNFGSSIPQSTIYYHYLQYKDYILRRTHDLGITLLNINTLEDVSVYKPTVKLYTASIYEDFLYCVAADGLHCCNLLTGEEKVFDVREGESGILISGFTRIEDDIFISYGSSLIYRVNMKDGILKKLCVDCGEGTYYIKELFTAGGKLFAVKEMLGTSKNTLIQLEITDDLLIGRELGE